MVRRGGYPHHIRGPAVAPGRAAQVPARRAGRLPVPRRQGQGHLRRQGEVDPQARRLPLLQPGHPRRPTRWSTRSRRRVRARRSRRPRRCWPSRASSSSTSRASTSACATTSPIRSSRSRWTRTSRASTSRASATAATALYFGPYSNAKRVARHARPARQDLPVPLLPGRGAGPAHRLAVPGLLHQALRGALRRLRRQGASTASRSTA